MTEAAAPAQGGRGFIFFACYAVSFGMVVCISLAIIHFIQWLIPTWDAGSMLVVCMLAFFEAIASHWLIRQISAIQHQMIVYRASEWVVIILILKIFAELSLGPASFYDNFRLWLVQFPMNIVNGRLLLAVIPFVVIWWISSSLDNDLSLLGAYETNILKEENIKTTSVRDLLLRRFLNLGLLIVVLAGIPPQVVIPGPQAAVPNSAPAVVVYFILGIILLSLTRYSYLVSTWRVARVNIPAQIPRRWFFYSAVLIGGLSLFIILLPTNYGMGLFDTFTSLVNIITNLIVNIYLLILFFFHALFNWLFPPSNIIQPDVIIPPQAPQVPQAPPSPSLINWTLIKSIIFWALLLFLVVVALRQFIIFNKDLAEELKRFRPLRWLVLFWKRITASIKKANKSVGIFVQSSLMRLRTLGRTPSKMSDWEYINPRRLNARQKIIFYYLALVRRAGEVGFVRQVGQTPYEYARSLTSRLEPEMQGGRAEVEDLTASFVEARYSLHDIPTKQARRVETIWEIVRRLFRHVRKSQREKEKLERD
jgi:hypothetical protein